MKYLLLIAAVFISVCSFKTIDLNSGKTTAAAFALIGKSAVDFKTGMDVISIANPAAYTALQIKTPDAPVHIESLSIIYTDGTPDKIPVRYDFKAGEASRNIVLKSNKRVIKEVDVMYAKVVNSTADKAAIEIWGM